MTPLRESVGRMAKRMLGGSRSIRETLTLWYIGILAVILAFFGCALYLSVAAGLARDVDKTLALQADHVAGTIFAFREAEETAPGSAGGNWESAPPGTFLGGIVRGQLPELLGRWASKTDNLRTSRPLRLVDRYGRPLVASENFTQLDLPITKTALKEALKKHTFYETFRRSGQRIRLVTRPVIEQGRILYLVQVAASLRQVDMKTGRFLFSLLVLIPMTLVLARSAGRFLATTALQPVGLMIGQAKRISSQRLEERIPVPEAADELNELAVTFNDMLSRLERDFRRLRRFSAAASHELRTPLTVIRGELEVALRRPRTPEEYERVLRVYLQKADEMTSIVEELLMLAHQEATDRVVEWKPVNLSALTREVSQTWEKVAQTKSVRMEIPAHEPVWVRGERRLLERLVANLLDNAIKHTPAQGRVTLRSDRQGNMASLSVQDTGSGIPPGELPHIFDRFFRGGSGTDGVHSTGLGLGLCRWIVEVHHGQIDVSSAPGQGATFTAWFPLVQPSS
ncbi:MAG: HAMP domain-containing protein [Candidatus Omnitrophica bacterium]|nr:HAMP domain-containing protein [Candidatus Omnitrophota bacterium]